MHASARRGLVRLLGGAGALALLVLLVVTLFRSCRSEEERLSEMVDDARDALVERRRDDFLANFADDVRYRKGRDRKALERDLDTWIEARVGQIAITDRKIAIRGDDARIDLVCDVGSLFTGGMTVTVQLHAVRTADGWRVEEFDWKQ